MFFYTGNSLTEFLRNEHLVVVGNDLNGSSKMWITPKLSAPSVTVTVPIGPDYTVSSAYTEQSSRSRELIVESSYINNATSLHHVFVPLEDGVLNVTFIYNGSTAQDLGNETPITVVQPHTLYRFGNPCPRTCASLGVYRIRDSLYTLCASSSGVCRCKLSQINRRDSMILLSRRECRRLVHPNTGITVEHISDVIAYLPSRVDLHLLFISNNFIYQDNLIYSVDELPIHFSDSENCQVVLRLQKFESKLLIYCANNTMVVYNFDTEALSQFNNHLYFPCSDTANFSVDLTNNEHADIHYYNAPQQFSQLNTTSRHFKFGECIEYEDHHLFLYTDRSNNLHLLNSSMSALPVCMNISLGNQYVRPPIIHERYIITHSLDHQTTSVYDLKDVRSPIITQQDIMLHQLVTVVSNLSTVVNIEPTSTLSSIAMTISPTPSHPIATSTLASTSTVVTTAVTYGMTTSPVHATEQVIWPPVLIAIAVLAIVLFSSVGGCTYYYR